MELRMRVFWRVKKEEAPLTTTEPPPLPETPAAVHLDSTSESPPEKVSPADHKSQ
jgi:hypothetical protein